MRKFVKVNETVITPLEPRRVDILGNECLLDVRFVESHSETGNWLYEYEVIGEVGKVERFLNRLRDIERKRDVR
ncbi:hypothetical protein [Sporomusa sp.]|uniref:hypothetical protein n=1 Tax=Sporomusa sp. TaxID=2078658 RepID=UPI002C0B6141|nr:hypothetical protein [Sporomusa sp.]MDF2876392.1 hypothetical protein [Sporomusa sp.]HWR05429.1 hypothetical protein [Sporomusa sp.]